MFKIFGWVSGVSDSEIKIRMCVLVKNQDVCRGNAYLHPPPKKKKPNANKHGMKKGEITRVLRGKLGDYATL